MSTAVQFHLRERADIHLSVMVRTSGSPQPYMFMTENVSGGGVLLSGAREKYPFAEDDIVEVLLYPFDGDNASIEYQAKIARWKGTNSLALEIVNITKPNEERLHALMDFCKAMGKF